MRAALSSIHVYEYGGTPPVVVAVKVMKGEDVVPPFCTGAPLPSTADVIVVLGVGRGPITSQEKKLVDCSALASTVSTDNSCFPGGNARILTSPDKQEIMALASSAHEYVYGGTPPEVVKVKKIEREDVAPPFGTGALLPSTAVIDVTGPRVVTALACFNCSADGSTDKLTSSNNKRVGMVSILLILLLL